MILTTHATKLIKYEQCDYQTNMQKFLQENIKNTHSNKIQILLHISVKGICPIAISIITMTNAITEMSAFTDMNLLPIVVTAKNVSGDVVNSLIPNKI